MFHKVIFVQDKEVPERIKKACEGLQPGYATNRLPVNLREITMEEFAQSKFFTYTPEYTRFNQCPEKEGTGPGTGIINWHEYWYSDGTGFAFVQDYWRKKVRVFKLGCEHKWSGDLSSEELTARYPEHAGKYQGGRCMHNTVCTLCRVLWIYDSSD